MSSAAMVLSVLTVVLLLEPTEFSIVSVLVIKVLVGASVFVLTHLSLWLLMKRPTGVETRIAQIIERF